MFQEFLQDEEKVDEGGQEEHTIACFMAKVGLTGQFIEIRDMKITKGITKIIYGANPKGIFMQKVYDEKDKLLLTSELTVPIFKIKIHPFRI